ncbi:hypothetical protein EDB84DRAFT_824606 [Lactarius hengduanensis]|nr:hypothetical protein EDB84DRAFT_824606 [Lactarius hengduanensis]
MATSWHRQLRSLIHDTRQRVVANAVWLDSGPLVFLSNSPRTNSPPLLTTLSFTLPWGETVSSSRRIMRLTLRRRRTQNHPGAVYPASSQNPQRRCSSEPRDPRHEDATMTSDPSLAWLTASAIMHLIQFAVSEQASVGSSNMKEHYICPLPKVDCGADVLLLVPGSHDPVASRSRRRGAKWRASGSCSCSILSHLRLQADDALPLRGFAPAHYPLLLRLKPSGTVGRRHLLERRQRQPNRHTQARMMRTGRCVPRRPSRRDVRRSYYNIFSSSG